MSEPVAGALRVIIIGGGVSGASVAAALQRAARPDRQYDVVLVDPRPDIGAGQTYDGGSDPLHRVNVPSVRMVAGEMDPADRQPGKPADYHGWCIANGVVEEDPDSQAGDLLYPTRASFGRYLTERFRALFSKSGPVRISQRKSTALAARKVAGGYVIDLADGGVLEGDVLVLATGNPPPALPAMLSDLEGDPRLVQNPWGSGVLSGIGADDRVLIIGTGLSMGDAVATLNGQGHRGPVTALSRRGLVPRPRPDGHAESWTDYTRDVPDRLSELLHRVRQDVIAANSAGRPWTDVMESLRVGNNALWASLSADARSRFQRHLRIWWDIHRFQAAPQIADLLDRQQRAGHLTIRAGRLISVTPQDNGIAAVWQPRGTSDRTAASFDAVINCTGAGHGVAFSRNPLLASLARAGLIRSDDLGIGIAVDTDHRAINPDGNPADSLFVVGPPTRGSLGEVVGASEITPHSEALGHLLAGLQG